MSLPLADHQLPDVPPLLRNTFFDHRFPTTNNPEPKRNKQLITVSAKWREVSRLGARTWRPDKNRRRNSFLVGTRQRGKTCRRCLIDWRNLFWKQGGRNRPNPTCTQTPVHTPTHKQSGSVQTDDTFYSPTRSDDIWMVLETAEERKDRPAVSSAWPPVCPTCSNSTLCFLLSSPSKIRMISSSPFIRGGTASLHRLNLFDRSLQVAFPRVKTVALCDVAAVVL